MCKNTLIIRRGDEFNPESRCGQPTYLPDGRRIFHTWYTNELFLSYATDKMMDALVKAKVVTRRRSSKTVLYERPRYTYYGDGLFWVPVSRKNSKRTGNCYEFEPFTGTLRCEGWKKYQRRNNLPDALIHVMDGFPIAVVIDGDEFQVTSDSWPTMEAYLGLDESYKPEKYRPRRAA